VKKYVKRQITLNKLKKLMDKAKLLESKVKPKE
jgi:hypothetical protein